MFPAEFNTQLFCDERRTCSFPPYLQSSFSFWIFVLYFCFIFFYFKKLSFIKFSFSIDRNNPFVNIKLYFLFFAKFIVYIYSFQAIFSYPPSLFSLLFSICLKLFQHFNRQKSNNNMHLPIIGDLVKQVRTPPVRPADGVVGCVYESFVLGVLSWCGAAGEDKVCGAHSRSVKCIALLSSTGPR